MNARVSIDDDPASFIKETGGHPDGYIWPKTWFAFLVKALWPIKGAVAVEQYAQVPDRTARNYQSGHSEPPGSVVCNLLRGNEGYRVLKWIMVGATPTWWINVEAEMHFAKEARAILNQLDCLRSART